MRLSHSAQDKYSRCSMKYKLHYIDGYRDIKLRSPLFFGSALDEAFSHLLLKKKEELTELELDLQLKFTPEEMFVNKMLKVGLNGEEVELAQSPLADYYTSDFDESLLNSGSVKQLQVLEPTYKLINFIDFHTQCREQLKARKRLENNDHILYNYMSWLSLVEKGKLMIKAYESTIIPQIHRVYDIQKPISIKNEDGDEISGFIDFTAAFTDSPSVTYVCDNKSSSKAYEADSVKESSQLATYCEAEKTNKAAYVVVEKKIFKREPKIRTSIIRDEIPEKQFVKTFDKFVKTCYSIEQGIFVKNESSCFAFGKVCEFYKLCKYNSTEGLFKIEKT